MKVIKELSIPMDNFKKISTFGCTKCDQTNLTPCMDCSYPPKHTRCLRCDAKKEDDRFVFCYPCREARRRMRDIFSGWERHPECEHSPRVCNDCDKVLRDEEDQFCFQCEYKPTWEECGEQ